MFNIFKKKSSKDQYLGEVASILNTTMGAILSMENAYNLAAECLEELKGKISKGVFPSGPNPRQVIMAYYSLSSMVNDAPATDDKMLLLQISIMARSLSEKFKNQGDFTPLEKGICLFCEAALSESTSYSTKDVTNIKMAASKIIVDLVHEQGASVSKEDIGRLIENIASNLTEKDVYKAGEKVLALSAISNVTAYYIDQCDLDLAYVYAKCFDAALNKYCKGKEELFNAYQTEAFQTILQSHRPVLEELMKAKDSLSAMSSLKGKTSDVINEEGEAAYAKGDYADAIAKFKFAVAQGNAIAQFNMGSMHRTGSGVEKNFAEAAKWFKLAADQGNASAQNSIGILYGNGEGVVQDHLEALKYFTLAATQGHVGAQFSLGKLYLSGEGIALDYTEALKWFTLAAVQGHQGATIILPSVQRRQQEAVQDDA